MMKTGVWEPGIGLNFTLTQSQAQEMLDEKLQNKTLRISTVTVSDPTSYSAVQINVVKGCVSAVLVHATFDPVYLDSRVYLFRRRAGLNDPIWRRVVR